MASLGSHRANFTWALNEYNRTEDADKREKCARDMARYIANAERNGFPRELVTREKSYPAEVDKYISEPGIEIGPELTEEQAQKKISQIVDTADVIRIGEGSTVVYAYGYRCCPDRLKVGYTEGDTVQRIADQIYTSTPDKPVLHVEIRTGNCRALERAIQNVLEVRGRKIAGGGDEWFKTSREEILTIYQFIIGS